MTKYEKALELIKNEHLVVNICWLSIIEAAEGGDQTAMHKLHIGFKLGKWGLSPNYGMSLRYLNQLREDDGDNEILKFYSTRCLGDTHDKFGNFDEAVEQYIIAARIMVNLPLGEWDFEMLQTIEKLSTSTTHF